MTQIENISKFFNLKLDYNLPLPAGYYVKEWNGLDIGILAYPHTINHEDVRVNGAYLVYLLDFSDSEYMGNIIFSPFELDPKKLFAVYNKQITLQLRKDIPKTIKYKIYGKRRLTKSLTEILNQKVHRKAIYGNRRKMLENLIMKMDYQE